MLTWIRPTGFWWQFVSKQWKMIHSLAHNDSTVYWTVLASVKCEERCDHQLLPLLRSRSLWVNIRWERTRKYFSLGHLSVQWKYNRKAGFNLWLKVQKHITFFWSISWIRGASLEWRNSRAAERVQTLHTTAVTECSMAQWLVCSKHFSHVLWLFLFHVFGSFDHLKLFTLYVNLSKSVHWKTDT